MNSLQIESAESDKEASDPPATPGYNISKIDLNDRCWYLNRELTWLAFKRRVLAEAENESVPLLERLKFIAIVSANIDEFFMKRIGGLKQQIGAGMRKQTPDGRSPRRQVVDCQAAIKELEAYKESLLAQVLKLLKQKGVVIACYEELTAKEKDRVREQYREKIFPLLTPQSIDPAHPFPFISNLSLNLLVTLCCSNTGGEILTRIKVPAGLGILRFIRVGSGERFVRLEDVMMNTLDMLFPGMEILSCELFRVTRNANVEKSVDEADDLIVLIESELQERKFSPIVRLEVAQGMAVPHRLELAAKLQLDEEGDVFEVSGMLAMRDLQEITGLDCPRLHDPPHYPLDHPALLSTRNIFHIIREEGPILLQHPYQSFATSVERFLREAALDPKVRGIKMTLYRTSGDSSLIDSLVQAANNGKQVAVVIELKAHFDEEANMRLAERMEEAGIHVTFGVVGLKTYCKLILVVRRDYNGLKRYVHIGSGNYHADKSRVFSDIGMLTCDDAIGGDATELFNYLTTGFTPKRNYKKLLPAPKLLKKALLSKIERETALHSKFGNGRIRFKMNALEDVDCVKALYRASMTGVKIELVVRDTCRLRPGIPGISDNIRVTSVVGRFMEHSRIYNFGNNGDEEYFIGSADLMKRNLEARVELLCPVEFMNGKRELDAIFAIHASDTQTAWEMKSDGSYIRRQPFDGGKSAGTHQMMIGIFKDRLKRIKKEKKAEYGSGGKKYKA